MPLILFQVKGKSRFSNISFTLAFPWFDGVYLPKEENEFVHQVLDELETYQKSIPKSVLLFPPLPSRLRYLIHRTIEDLPELTTFSVGESWWRRVVVCPLQLRGETREEDNDMESNSTLDEELEKRGEDTQAQPPSSTRSRAPKRPDKALYIPKAARERSRLQNSHQELPQPAPGDPSNSCSSSETTEKSSLDLKEESVPRAVAGALGDDPSRGEEADLTSSDHEGEHLQWENKLSCLSDMSLEEDAKDDTATCDLTEEIKEHLKEGATFSVTHVHNDYSTYENVLINPDNFRHVIEIYDFPAMLKTDDLLDAFTEYSHGGMKITWVDNTHARGVFSTEEAALNALSICHPLLKARALAEGSKKAKGKAVSRAEFMQPVKDRPKTDSAVARRMVGRALGLKERGRGRGQSY
ncbi:R3H and coiled-coil domain-containing protein 1 [Dunckerocampus dactyliophorus]|uniref:R3H and coiled-coil domain-containing protein 1 n=1 Tax=Dunckerocampus dactyliophorus TaxID=161453 RepID=UPI0024049AE0|nr:R3H and coiled-coil domain-containing protein 1 [Dunckerocampus dactyliophorus]